MLRSGVIGLGKIGMPMARRVLGKGFPLAVRDVRAEAMESLAEGGARACASPAEVARHSDVICVVVLDDAQVEEVLLGPVDGRAPPVMHIHRRPRGLAVPAARFGGPDGGG